MSKPNTDINFLDKILLSHDAINLINKGTTTTKELLTSSFDSSLISLKIFFILLLTVLAFMNKYFTFINNNKTTFTIETILYGAFGAFPFLYMLKYRKKNGENKNYFFIFTIMFLLYAFFNIILEIGGLYSYLYENEDIVQNNIINNYDIHKNKHQIIFNNIIYSTLFTIALVLIYIIIYMFLITFDVFDFNIQNYQNNFYLLFICEIIIFALCNSLPFFLIAYNREKNKFTFNKNAIDVILIFIKFAILHLLLQGSGFYKHSLGI